MFRRRSNHFLELLMENLFVAGDPGPTLDLNSIGDQRSTTKMIVNMKADATEAEIRHVIERIEECGYQAHIIRGSERTDRKSTRLNSSHIQKSRMPSSA